MSEPSQLEQLALAIQEADDAHEAAKLVSDQLKADELNYLSALMNALEQREFVGQKISDSKLERIVRGTEEFRAYVRGRVLAEAKTLHLKNKRDNLKVQWESERSDQSLERQKYASGIYKVGRG